MTDNGATRRQRRVDSFLLWWGRYRDYRALITLLLVVALYFTARIFYGGQDKTAQLKFVESPSDQTAASSTPEVETLKPVLSGGAYETAMRLRESGALLMAVSLSSFEEFRVNGRFPATVAEILAGLQERSLLPPGTEIKDGVLRSTLSELKLNYRAEPFGFEILSLPISKPGGPAILFRFPLPPAEANSVMYFQHPAGRSRSCRCGSARRNSFPPQDGPSSIGAADLSLWMSPRFATFANRHMAAVVE
ncbi:MAG: hypothetical protein UZ17_ACD001002873 [Acidobacteria bacterium OLB17]|nr:MAG: hypothetical protein UZ17_ACD001002873 [Acidobacteria bacterium OLB17]